MRFDNVKPTGAREARRLRCFVPLICSAFAACMTTEPRTAPNPDAASSDSARAPTGAVFYAARPYGSEAEFNPLSTVINEGFDHLTVDGANRHVFTLNYGVAATNVAQSAFHPVRAWKTMGWNAWFRDEILPVTNKGKGGEWFPGYELHVFGEGMTSAALREWYVDQGMAHPELLADVTNVAYGFINEMIEHPTGNGTDQNVATRVVINDPLGLLLFHFDAVCNLFSGPVRITTWFPQAVLTFPGPTLQNATELYMMRARVPHLKDWRPMLIFGGGPQLTGLSRRLYADRWLSLAVGANAVSNPVIDSLTGLRTAILKPEYGAFLDRDGSLLADVEVRFGETEQVVANVYPSVVHFGSYSPGFVIEYLKTHQVRLGVVAQWGLGIAGGPAK